MTSDSSMYQQAVAKAHVHVTAAGMGVEQSARARTKQMIHSLLIRWHCKVARKLWQSLLTSIVTAAGWVVVDPTRVEDKGVWRCVHRDSHWALGEQGLLQRVLTPIGCHKITL